ncbi:MOSC N-terminal beta barrel domain-containing protein [Allopusillimonas ginsengisoli]|uniref:MOSC N-terminal beta barrel domain-containing protein n=1 Tax=Allopusillimonas ginsengisoli TaxID=453575 RepID=UPI00101E989E|nr:MOSC N-terminal beta barrel domain-containing protein [Allopusillimonas ginsengisoli]TEA78242.1 hypothetical protein ERE07_10520 [Allopusillimonas ginsengisoli]
MTQSIYYPIVDCAGLSDAVAAECDRRWLVVDDAGVWLAQDRCDRLSEIQVGVRFGYLVVKAPGMLRLDIPIDVIEDDDSVRRSVQINAQQADVVDEGDLAASWFSNFLGQPCRLVKLHPEAPAVNWPSRPDSDPAKRA